VVADVTHSLIGIDSSPISASGWTANTTAYLEDILIFFWSLE
jgi:hypothetical protein